MSVAIDVGAIGACRWISVDFLVLSVLCLCFVGATFSAISAAVGVCVCVARSCRPSMPVDEFWWILVAP